MFMRNFFRAVCMFAVVMTLLSVPATPKQATNVATGQMAVALQAPPFVNIAYAEGASPADFDLGEYLDQEAGISAYFHSPDAITLSQVRGQFRTIEMETPDFIIGSVAVPNYLESADPHVYVHTSGWIMAYYLRPNPVSKIIDTRGTPPASINNTKLKTVVAAIASAAGAPFTDVTYYDFHYPNATNMLFVAEDWANGNSFTIQVSSAYGYFERGWALRNDCGSLHSVSLDGVALPPLGADHSCEEYGTISASQLLPDVTHTVAVSEADWAFLVILYRVP